MGDVDIINNIFSDAIRSLNGLSAEPDSPRDSGENLFSEQGTDVKEETNPADSDLQQFFDEVSAASAEIEEEERKEEADVSEDEETDEEISPLGEDADLTGDAPADVQDDDSATNQEEDLLKENIVPDKGDDWNANMDDADIFGENQTDADEDDLDSLLSELANSAAACNDDTEDAIESIPDYTESEDESGSDTLDELLEGALGIQDTPEFDMEQQDPDLMGIENTDESEDEDFADDSDDSAAEEQDDVAADEEEAEAASDEEMSDLESMTDLPDNAHSHMVEPAFDDGEMAEESEDSEEMDETDQALDSLFESIEREGGAEASDEEIFGDSGEDEGLLSAESDDMPKDLDMFAEFGEDSEEEPEQVAEDDTDDESDQEEQDETDAALDSLLGGAEDEGEAEIDVVETVKVPEPSIEVSEDIDGDEELQKRLAEIGLGDDCLLHNSFSSQKEKLLHHLMGRFEYIARKKLEKLPDDYISIIKTVNLKVEIDLKFGEFTAVGDDDSLFNIDV